MYSELKETPRFRIELFGESNFFEDSKIVYPPLNLARILTYAVINGQDLPISRQRIANMIWSNNSTEKVNADLRQTLVRIKRFQREYKVNLLAADNKMVWLTKGQSVYIDLLEFLGLLANPGPKAWVRICEIYGGDLLGSHRPAGEEFEEWLECQRHAIRSSFINTISQAILPTSPLTPAERQICASRLLREAPYHEGAYRALMYVAASHGDMSLTRRLFKECSTVLQKELGVNPTAETDNYYKSLMACADTSLTI